MEYARLSRVKRTMTPREGLDKVREFMNHDVMCLGCRDYGSMYMYIVGPPDTDTKIKTFVGSPKFVDKKTGKVSEYDDIKLKSRQSWKPVDLMEVKDGR